MMVTVAHCAIAAIGGGWIGEAGVVVMVGALDAGVRCIGIIEAWRAGLCTRGDREDSGAQ